MQKTRKSRSIIIPYLDQALPSKSYYHEIMGFFPQHNHRHNPTNSKEVILSLPKFEHRLRCSMKPILQKMGVHEVFTTQADLSKIANETYVTQIIHEVVVKLDENGTEAAAATAIMTNSFSVGESKGIIFNANHPFYYAIIHVPSHLNLFSGIYSPE